jgi:hypothetical protein
MKMSNDNGLVDEYEKIKIQKQEIEAKEEELRNKIIELSKEKNTDTLFGNHKKCSIKEYEKIVYPEEKELFLELVKKKGIYDKFSSLNYFKLGPAIMRGEVDKEVSDLTKKEKAFRVSLKDI